MKGTDWKSAEFDYGYEKADASKRSLIWDALTDAQRQLYLEWKLFGGFARAELGIPQENAITLEPSSCVPPAPDIGCNVSGNYRFFELGEIVEQGVAKGLSQAYRDHEKVVGFAVDIWTPLEYVLEKKCSKRYCAEATPLELILYYGVGRQPAFFPFLNNTLAGKESWIRELIKASHFGRVWLFDDHAKTVLATFSPDRIEIR